MGGGGGRGAGVVVSEDPACKRQTRTTSDAAKRAQDLHRCSACSRGQPWLVGRAMDGASF